MVTRRGDDAVDGTLLAQFGFEVHKTGLWHRPTFHREMSLEMALPSQVIIKDETLREGEETPGVACTPEGRARLAFEIAKAGIREIGVGYPASRPADAKLMKLIDGENDIRPRIRAIGHARGWVPNLEEELIRTIDAGVDMVNVVQVVTLPERARAPHLTLDNVPEKTAVAVQKATEYGGVVALGFLSALRCPPRVLRNCHDQALDAGAERVYVYDGQGCGTPETIGAITRRVAMEISGRAEIAIHAHNDFGLAVANTISAIVNGATVADCVINGMGDRAGNASLETVVAALTVLYQIETGVELSSLGRLSDSAASIFGLPVQSNSPILGGNVYRHATDSHIEAILRGDWYAYENIHPSVFGKHRSLEFDSKVKKDRRNGSLATLIKILGLPESEEAYECIYERILMEAASDGFVSVEKAERIVRECYALLES